jgi:ferredoxin-NADP reductase
MLFLTGRGRRSGGFCGPRGSLKAAYMSAAAIATATMSRLVSRQVVAERTIACRFEKPADWHFQAGQFLDLGIIAPSESDAEGDTRSFSIASAPHEETLMVATRLRDSAFKRELTKMPLGCVLTLAGPSGDLIFDPRAEDRNAQRPAVFLAGGIGITPFRSMVLQAAHEKSPRPIFLFYSNRRPEDAPFLEELQAIEKRNPHYHLIASMTKMERSHRPWHGEAGPVDKEMLARHLQDVVAPVYYIAGPPDMVRSLRALVRQCGVVESDIRAEEFDGYQTEPTRQNKENHTGSHNLSPNLAETSRVPS